MITQWHKYLSPAIVADFQHENISQEVCKIKKEKVHCTVHSESVCTETFQAFFLKKFGSDIEQNPFFPSFLLFHPLESRTKL